MYACLQLLHNAFTLVYKAVHVLELQVCTLCLTKMAAASRCPTGRWSPTDAMLLAW